MSQKQTETINALTEQLATANARIKELEAKLAATPAPTVTVSKVSKSMEQALAGLEMLKAGPVTKAQFAALNEKYPTDVPYNIRTLLKTDVMMKKVNGVTYYCLPGDVSKLPAPAKTEAPAQTPAEGAASAPKEAVPAAA